MPKDDFVCIGHMLELARKAVARVAGLDRAAYDANENLRLALTHLVQTIGKAARRSPGKMPNRAGRTHYAYSTSAARAAALFAILLLCGCGPAYWTHERFAADGECQPFLLQHCAARYVPHPADRPVIRFWGPERGPHGLEFRDVEAPSESSVVLGNIGWAEGQWDFGVDICNSSGIAPEDHVSFSAYVGGTRPQTFRLQFAQPPIVMVTGGCQAIAAEHEDYGSGSIW